MGVDEAGRGPLAGSLFAAAVILPLTPVGFERDLADSKTLSAAKREALFVEITANSRYAVAIIRPTVIDKRNIHAATLHAMRTVIVKLHSMLPAAQGSIAYEVCVDGKFAPSLPAHIRHSCRAIVKGDATVPAIAAASIVAKVLRDAHMVRLHEAYPEYGFAVHKGYPTKAHIAALTEHGTTPWHRKTYRPVARVLARQRSASVQCAEPSGAVRWI